MNRLKHPCLWLPLSLALLVAIAAPVLNTRACKTLDERDWSGYGHMNAWQSVFDACSAACGVGWLTYDLDHEYTALGRWLITGLGLVGAGLFLTAAAAVSRRLWDDLPNTRFPPIWWVPASFAGVLVIGVLTALVVEKAWNGDVESAACRALSAVASLGWAPGHISESRIWLYAILSLLGAVGWPIWCLPWLTGRRRLFPGKHLLGLLAGFMAFLLLATLVVWVLEGPRGGRPAAPESEMLTGQPAGARFARALLQVVCASTAGMSTENLQEQNVTDGTRLVLSLVVLVGPLGGAAGGGMKWTVLAAGLVGCLAVFRRRSLRHKVAALPALLAGLGGVLVIPLLALLTALGLLVIEARTASVYQPPPTFAEAMLDAGAAVGGANLTTGVVRSVTHRNLSRGIRQNVDLYQYGMVWLMAAMLLGRIAPLYVLNWVASLRLTEEAGPPPPLV